MMTITQREVTVGEITLGYVNNDEQGVRGYNGKLDIRPPYQREFIYNEKEQQAVITTVRHHNGIARLSSERDVLGETF